MSEGEIYATLRCSNYVAMVPEDFGYSADAGREITGQMTEQQGSP